MKKSELLAQKLGNFVKFIATLEIDNKEEILKIFASQLNDQALFIFSVNDRLVPYFISNKLDDAYELFIKHNKINTDKITPEQKEKIIKYISCFCELSM